MKQQTQINKNEWKEIALGDIFEFENKTGIKAGEGLEEGKYKFFTSSDNQSKFLDRFNFKGEHLIFSTGGKAGLHYCNEPFSVSNDCFIVKVKSHSTKFIYYLLKSKIYLLERGFKGAGLKHLSKDYLKKINIKLPFLPDGTPDLKEQERIVKILEENEGQIKRAYRAEELLNEYLKSVFNEMFGNPRSNPKKWELKKLSDFGKWQSGGTPPRTKLEYYVGDLPWYISRELNNMFLSDSVEKINLLAIKETSAKLIKKNSLLLGMYDTAALKSSISLKECSCNQAIAFSNLENGIVNIFYLYSVIQMGRKHYMSQQRGVRQKNLNLSMIKNLKIPLPPLPLQQKFSRIVEQVEKMKENVNKTKQNAEELFNSLMTKAFRGEL